MRNSPETAINNKRQTRIDDYWFNKQYSVSTSNIYEKLNVEEIQESNTENNTISANKTAIKSPPIFIGVENIIPLKKVLNKTVKPIYIKNLKRQPGQNTTTYNRKVSSRNGSS